jgi:hypothetical protein
VRGLVLQHGARRSTLSTIEGRCAAVLFLLDPDPPSVARLPERSRVSPPHYRRRKAANRSAHWRPMDERTESTPSSARRMRLASTSNGRRAAAETILATVVDGSVAQGFKTSSGNEM